MASCAELLAGIEGSCAATKRPGGVDKRVWIGVTTDLDGITFAADKNEITALTFVALKGLKKFIGRKEKHNGNYGLEVGDNVNLINQSFNLVLYVKTAAERKALDDLLKVNDGVLFVAVENNDGTIEIWGINRDQFENFGLKPSGLTGGTGTVLNDSTAFTVTLSGNFQNSAMLFNEATAIDTNIAALDALVV